MKRCNACRQHVEVGQFHRSSRSRDGLQAKCKPCQANDKKARLAAKQVAIRLLLAEHDGKRCPRCQTFKPWVDFHRLSTAKDGRQVYCKPCGADIQREYKARHKDVVALRQVAKLEQSVTIGVKTCTKCGGSKPMLSFYQHRGTRDGRAAYCKECQKASSRAWNAAHREQIKQRNVERRRLHPGEAKRNSSTWHFRLYGLTEQQYNAMSESQGHGCAICGRPETVVDSRTGETRRLSIDHDHETLKVRGLLCGNCNRGIGSFSDNHELLDKAADYLKKAARMP